MKRYIIAGLVVVFLAATAAITVWAVRVNAAAATIEQQQVIANFCDQLKAQLETIQKNETAVRVNRGHIYNLDVIPYITTFNSRIAANKVDAPELISLAAQIQSAVTDYANKFTIYSDDLTNAQHVDCRTKPGEFYDWIDKARADRATLARQVTRIDQLVAEYIAGLQRLDERFTPVINTDKEPE